MRWTRLFLFFLAALFLVLGAGAAFVWTADLNDYKPDIEQLVARATGRAFSIDGRIDLELGRHTSLTVTGVHLGNSDWASSETMVRAARVHVVVDIRSLWAGPIIIDRVQIEGAELNLEKQESGENNWTFGARREKSSGSPISLVLREAQIDDFNLTIAVPVLDHPLEIHVSRLGQVQNSDGLFDAKIRGTLNGRAVAVAGEYGPLESLLTARNLNLDIAGQFGTLSVTVSGLIDDLLNPRRPRGHVQITGPDIDDVTAMFGLSDMGSGDLDLAITLQPDRTDLRVAIIGRVGEHQFDTKGSVADPMALDRVSVRLSAHGPDLSEIGRLFGVEGIPTGPYELSGWVDRDGAHLDFDEVHLAIGAATLRLDGTLTQFPNLNGGNLSLDIRGERVGRFTRLFGLPGVVEGPFEIVGRLDIDSDGVEALRLDVTTDIIELTVVSTLSSEPDLAGTRAHVTGNGADLAAVVAPFDVPMPVSSPFMFTGDVELGRSRVILSDDATLIVGENRLLVSGVIGLGAGQGDTDLRGSVSGTDLAQLGRMVGVHKGVPSRAYEISGRFQMGSDGYRIGGLQARIGNTQLSADGVVSFRKDFVGSRLSVAATGPDFGELIADTETMKFPGGPFDLSGNIEMLVDAVHLTDIDIKLAGATAVMNVDIGLPLESAKGTFEVLASGDSLAAVLPDSGLWEPSAKPFEIQATGSIADGLVYVEPVTIRVGEGRLSAAGVVDIPPDLSRTSLTIEARVANLETIGTFEGRRLPKTDFSLDAKFAGTTQSFSIEQFQVKSGASDLAGNVVVHLDRTVPEVILNVRSNLLDMTPLMMVGPEAGAEPEPGPEPDEFPVDDRRVIPQWMLPLKKLASFDADVDIGIATYRQQMREIANLALRVTVRDGRLDVDRASGTTAFGSASAKLSVVPVGDTAQVHVEFEGDNIFLGVTGDRTREEIDASPKYKMSIVLDGRGTTLRDLAATLNGQVQIGSDGGRAVNTALRFFYGNFIEELFTAVNPFAKTDPYTEVRCVMLVADIENGRLEAKPGLALQTNKMNIVSEGAIDLRTEKLDINFRTAPRKKISISAGEFINPYLKVGGTLAHPHLMLDPTGTLVTGGAAVATLGLSLVAKAVWDRVFSASDECGQVVIEADKNREKKKSKDE